MPGRAASCRRLCSSALARHGTQKCRAAFEAKLGESNFKLLGWRVVPTQNDEIGHTALQSEPHIAQIFLTSTLPKEEGADPTVALEKQAYLLRKRSTAAVTAVLTEGCVAGWLAVWLCSIVSAFGRAVCSADRQCVLAADESGRPATGSGARSLRAPSCTRACCARCRLVMPPCRLPSSRPSCLPTQARTQRRGAGRRLLTWGGDPLQVMHYFPDLQQDDFQTMLAMVHSRFSTNTFPSWDRAQPCRTICHNGEINTCVHLPPRRAPRAPRPLRR